MWPSSQFKCNINFKRSYGCTEDNYSQMTPNPSGGHEVMGIPTSFPGTFLFSLIQTEISLSGSMDETPHDPAGAASEEQPLQR